MQPVVDSAVPVTALVGNPKPASRTLTLATEVASQSAPDVEPDLIDLALYADEMFTWPSVELDKLVDRVTNPPRLLVVASPTYKGAYTGLLKAFLDRLGHNALRGVVAIPVMTAGDTAHSLAPDLTLRPLLLQLGAHLPTRSLYAVVGEAFDPAPVVTAWLDENRSMIGR